MRTFFDNALRLATVYVDIVTWGEGVLLHDQTIQKPYGYVFFYQSKKYLETGDITDMIFGNAPFIINHEMEIRVTGTAKPIETYLAEYEQTLPPGYRSG